MIALPVAGPFSRIRFERSADWVVVALAASLPWSTSATSILAAVWLAVLLPTLDIGALQRVLKTPAGFLPVALVAFAVLGLLWGGSVPWSERVAGLAQFAKLLAIPLLLVQFTRSDHGSWPLLAFFASCCVLLVYSWLLVIFPNLPSRGYPQGVPIKDYVIQSEIFAICVFVLLDRAVAASKEGNWRAVSVLIPAAAVFIANIMFIATARTTLVVMLVLFVLLGIRHFSRMQLAVFFAAIVACAVIVWTSSPYLRDRVYKVSADLETVNTGVDTSVGARIYWWRQSLAYIQDAPLIGHGTGSIRAMFRSSVADPALASASNPHNQIFAVGIQLGIAGIILLVALWIAHLRLFTGVSGAEWIGLVIVVQNAAGSLFNSHLFDFTQGWLYVVGVGVVGGAVIRRRLKAAS